MKNFKIKLSVLALACLGAGALALQPAAYAKAEGEGFNYNATGVVMKEGAAVALLDNFSGIRWTTTVDADWYKEVYATTQKDADGNEYKDEEDKAVRKFKGIRFGVVVAPTGSYDGELTKDTPGAIDLHAEGWKASTSADSTFYSVISYDKLLNEYTGDMTAEEVLAKAYSMELTVRAYARYTLADDLNTEADETNDWVYAYADMVDTSRSARQVALAAELAGELDAYRESTDATVQAKAQKAAGYYGMGADEDDYYTNFEISNGAAGTTVIDLEAVATADKDVGVKLTIADGYTVDEVLVGSKKVAATYADGTLTLNLTAGQALPTGETYVKVFAKNKDSDVVVYTKPIIGATKVLKSISDFDMFSAIRENLKVNSSGDKKIYAGATDVTSAEELSKYKFDGYYVLGKDLTFNADNDPALIADDDGYEGKGWYGTSSFAGTGLGLTGTFNGMGNWIRGYKDTRSYSGLFQLVNGGTIKNVYMYAYVNANATSGTITYASNSAQFAYYMIDPTIENVFVYNKYMNAQKAHYALGAYLYQTEEDAAKLSNLYIRAEYTKLSAAKNKGGLFGTYSGTTQTEYNWNNVYVTGALGAYYDAATKNGAINAFKLEDDGTETAIYVPTLKYIAESQKTETGYMYYSPDDAGAPVALTLTSNGMTAVLTADDKEYSLYTTSNDPTTTAITAPASVTCLNGVYVYYTNTAFQAAAPNLDFSSFTGVDGCNCWKVTNGILAWA